MLLRSEPKPVAPMLPSCDIIFSCKRNTESEMEEEVEVTAGSSL